MIANSEIAGVRVTLKIKDGERVTDFGADGFCSASLRTVLFDDWQLNDVAI